MVTNCDHLKKLKFSYTLPKVFTEHGAIMLASVLNSQRAVDAIIYVVRVFVRLREALVSHKDLALKLKELESKIKRHDEQIGDIIEAINQLLLPPAKPKRQIGFQVKESTQKYSSKKKRSNLAVTKEI